MQFSSICSIDWTLSGAKLWARMDEGAIAMKGYSAFHENLRITGPSPSDCLVLY